MTNPTDERLLALAGCINGIVFEFDSGARIFDVWTAEPALLVRPREELLGRTVEEVLGALAKPFTALVQRVLETGRSESIEYSIDVPSGRRWFFGNASRVHCPDGGFRVIYVARDITERKQSEQAIRASEERHRLVARASFDILWEWQIGADLLSWSGAGSATFGHEPQPVTLAWWKERLHPEDRERVTDQFHRFLEKPTGFLISEYRLRRGDGSYAEVEVRASMLLDRDGEPVSLIGALSDVTEKRRLEKQLAHSERMASLGTLAAGIAHEINNPLAYVLGNLRFALDELKGPSCDLAAVTEALLDAEQGGLRVRDIVRSMKEVSRSRDETSCELKQALDHAVKMVANEIHHRAQLTLQVPELPSVGIGQTQLVQLFLNLLLNAVQAFEGSEIESPHIRVEASVQRERVVVAVSDNGPGIPSHVVDRVFDPFFTTKEIGRGTGLGLSVCHGIAAGVGGSIRAESVPGAGTTFRIELPLARAEAEQAREEPARTVEQPRLARILLIDDDPQVARALARGLERRIRSGTVRVLDKPCEVAQIEELLPDAPGGERLAQTV